MEQDQPIETGCKKRPVWQWVIIYLVPILLVYGLVSYGFQPKKVAAPGTETLPVMGHTVTYTDSGFSPSTLVVKKGSAVTFVNASTKDVRVASNPHPIHDGYPTRDGCISSTFDSCSVIPPGGSWAFTFDLGGTWGYHDHLDPAQGGTVVVQ